MSVYEFAHLTISLILPIYIYYFCPQLMHLVLTGLCSCVNGPVMPIVSSRQQCCDDAEQIKGRWMSAEDGKCADVLPMLRWT